MAALLAGLALAFMAPGWWPGRVAAPMDRLLNIPPWQAHYPDARPLYGPGDLILQQLPWRQWMQDELRAGRFPLWAPGPLGGSPLFAGYQPGVLYPLHFLWALLPIGAGLGLIMAAKLWLAGLGMWGFLRALRLHPAAALLGAIGLMFAAWMINMLPWQLTSIYLLLPWLAWAVWAWCRDGRRWALPALAAGTAGALLAGHPEALFMTGVTLALWTVGTVITSPVRHWPRQALGLSVAVGLGFALSAIQLLPFFESFGLSHVAVARSPQAMPGASSRLGLEYNLVWLLPRQINYAPEGVLGGHIFTEMAGYAGLALVLGLPLALVGSLRREVDRRPLALWAIIGGLLWLVTYDQVLGGAIRRLPGFNQNVNIRFVGQVSFALLVVGAFGWDWLARRVEATAGAPNWRRGFVAGAGALLLVEGLAIMGVHFAGLLPPPVLIPLSDVLSQVTDSYRVYWAVWSAGVALTLLGATALWVGARAGPRLGPLLVGGVLLADLWRVTLPINPSAPVEYYYPETSFLRQVQQAVPPTERVLPAGEIMHPNTGLIYGIRDWRAQDALLSERAYRAAAMIDPDMPKSAWTEYSLFMSHPRLPIATLLGIHYFIFPAGKDVNYPVPPTPDQPPFKRLAYTEGLGLWEAEGVPGFTYLTDNVDPVPDGAAAAAWLQQQTWADVRAYPAVVEAPPEALAALQRNPAGASPGGTTVEVYTPGDIRIQTTAARSALLVVAESWYPGWRATLDGRPAPILRTNYLSQGVVVPVGTHRVEFRYQPDSVTFGAAISGLGLLGLLALGLWARRGMRNEE